MRWLRAIRRRLPDVVVAVEKKAPFPGLFLCAIDAHFLSQMISLTADLTALNCRLFPPFALALRAL